MRGDIGNPTDIVPISLKLEVGGVDLSHRVKSWEITFDFDAGAFTLDVVFTNHEPLVAAAKGLAPWDEDSDYNNSGPLLGQYNSVDLYIKKDGIEDWSLFFSGYIGPQEIGAGEEWGAADTVSATFVGCSHPLKDAMIEQRLALEYKNASIDSGAEICLLRRIILDQDMDYPVVYRDNPSYTLIDYIVSNVSVWDACENALMETGFRLVEMWDPDGERFAVTVVDPLRGRVTPTVTLNGGFRRRHLSGSETDTRTYVAVVYKEWPTGEEKYVFGEADQSVVNKYGVPNGKGGRVHRKMVYVTRDRSLIQTQTEAVELVAVMLHDLENPTPDCEIEMPYLDPRFEPWDLVRTIGEHSTVDVGVMEIAWRWSWEEPQGGTSLRGSAWGIIGAKSLWLSHDIKREGVDIRERLAELSKTIPQQPNAPEVTSSWYLGPSGAPLPVLDTIMSRVEWWVNGRIVRVIPFEQLVLGTITDMGDSWIEDSSKTWVNKQFSGPGRHWLYLPATQQLRRIKTTAAPHRVYIAEELDPVPSVSDAYIILKTSAEWSDNHVDVGPYHRVSGFEEGRYVAVQEARIPSGR